MRDKEGKIYAYIIWVLYPLYLKLNGLNNYNILHNEI